MDYDRDDNSYQMKFHVIQNLDENCQHDHISFNLKENGKIFLRCREMLHILLSMYNISFRIASVLQIRIF